MRRGGHLRAHSGKEPMQETSRCKKRKELKWTTRSRRILKGFRCYPPVLLYADHPFFSPYIHTCAV